MLSLKIKQLLSDVYEEGPLSLYVNPEDVAVKPIGNNNLLKPQWKSHAL